MEKERINELFGNIFNGFKQEIPKYSGNSFFKKNGINVYINKDVTYITAEIGKEKWAFSIRNVTLYERNLEIELSEDCVEIDDRIEMLLLDAFENVYEEIYNGNHKEQLEQESIINELFRNFVRRRKLETPNQAILNIKKPNKIYI